MGEAWAGGLAGAIGLAQAGTYSNNTTAHQVIYCTTTNAWVYNDNGLTQELNQEPVRKRSNSLEDVIDAEVNRLRGL